MRRHEAGKLAWTSLRDTALFPALKARPLEAVRRLPQGSPIILVEEIFSEEEKFIHFLTSIGPGWIWYDDIDDWDSR